jgi:hypothetical protein
MKQIIKYMPVIMLGLVIAGPALAAIVLPTPPTTGTGGVITGSSIMSTITQIFNYLVAISTVIAIAMFIWGGIMYAVKGDSAGGKKVMLNAAIGLLAILGVGLVVNSVAALVNRGLNIG